MGKPASRLLTLPWPFINMWPSSWLEHCFDKEVIGSREAELSLWLLFWWVEFAKHNFSEDGMQKKSSGHQNHKFSCTWKALFFGPPIAFNTVLCVFLNIFDPSLLNWSSHILTPAQIETTRTIWWSCWLHWHNLTKSMISWGFWRFKNFSETSESICERNQK